MRSARTASPARPPLFAAGAVSPFSRPAGDPVDPPLPATTSGPTLTTDVATDLPPPAPAATPPVQYDANGRLTGIEGVLDQVMESMGRTVTPLLQNQVWPMIQRDKALQREVGAAAGTALAESLRPVLTAGVIVLGVGLGGLLLVQIVKACK